MRDLEIILCIVSITAIVYFLVYLWGQLDELDSCIECCRDEEEIILNRGHDTKRKINNKT